MFEILLCVCEVWICNNDHRCMSWDLVMDVQVSCRVFVQLVSRFVQFKEKTFELLCGVPPAVPGGWLDRSVALGGGTS